MTLGLTMDRLHLGRLEVAQIALESLRRHPSGLNSARLSGPTHRAPDCLGRLATLPRRNMPL